MEGNLFRRNLTRQRKLAPRRLTNYKGNPPESQTSLNETSISSAMKISVPFGIYPRSNIRGFACVMHARTTPSRNLDRGLFRRFLRIRRTRVNLFHRPSDPCDRFASACIRVTGYKAEKSRKNVSTRCLRDDGDQAGEQGTHLSRFISFVRLG